VTKNFFASFIHSLAVSLLIILTVLGVVFVKLNSPSFLTDILKSQGSYSKAKAIIATYLSSSDQLPVNLSETQLASIVDAAFSESDLEKITNTIAADFYAWMKGQKREFTFNLDMSAKKPSIKAETAKIMDEYIKGLPECTSSQIARMEQSDVSKLDCRPALEYGVVLDSNKMAQDIVDQLPDNYSSSIPDNLKIIPDVYQKVYLGFVLLAVIAVLLFLLALLMMWRDKRKYFRWLGIGLIINGIPLLAIAYLTPRYFNSQLGQNISQYQDIPASTRELLQSVFSEFYRQINNGFYVLGVCLLIFGLAVLIFSYFFKKSRPKKSLDLGLVR